MWASTMSRSLKSFCKRSWMAGCARAEAARRNGTTAPGTRIGSHIIRLQLLSPALLLLAGDLPIGEWRPSAADLHVQTVRHTRSECARHRRPHLLERLDGLTAAAKSLHDSVVTRRAQFRAHRL